MARIYLNNDWKFSEEFFDKLNDFSYNDEELQTVRIPHTCKETPYHYFDEHIYQMVCGYRKHIFVPAEWQDKQLLLTIDGAAHYCELYINGNKVNTHSCGYTAFTTDISSYVETEKENLIVLKVNSMENQNIPPFGFVVDYMTYGGITREVFLEIKNKNYIDDVFVQPKVKEIAGLQAAATVRSSIALKGDFSEMGWSIQQFLISGENKLFLSNEYIQTNSVQMQAPVAQIELWDVERPFLYKLETVLLYKGNVIDTVITECGFRKAKFEEDGFYLNDRKLKIRGLNRHQSYPYVGYAMPESMQSQDADLLKKKLGCNAVRTSHYPQSHYFIKRCDELGLLVFMEFPGWQHIGDESWKEQALLNEKEMIEQYRNHCSIILWGVRINESMDDDAFYRRTNALAHELDTTRMTGGVRAHKKSQFFEDVYTYNDFLHDGRTPGCEKKKKVTPDTTRGYLISEYNGHMYPTKAFDGEEHRAQHALRHANVLDAVAEQKDIAGSFGWCMFDYNTHKDFGSGDRICYHGVMDMFRNPKMASLVYACQQENEIYLELSSSMDIGEHPGCNRGFTYIFSNADSVRMYKNDVFIKEYTQADSPYHHLSHGPMVIDDFIGDQIFNQEPFKKKQAKAITEALNYTATHGYGHYPWKIIWTAIKCLTVYKMKSTDAVNLYNKYVGDWGGTSTVYRFEAIKDGKIVKTLVKEPMKKIQLNAFASSEELVETNSYSVGEIFIRAVDENGNQLTYFNDPVTISTEGPVELIGPSVTALRGGMTGAYIRTTGKAGKALVTISNAQSEDVIVELNVKINN